jgi:IS30 family transposase
MSKPYVLLTPHERAPVMTMRDDRCSIRAIAKHICRSASTISRELTRDGDGDVHIRC